MVISHVMLPLPDVIDRATVPVAVIERGIPAAYLCVLGWTLLVCNWSSGEMAIDRIHSISAKQDTLADKIGAVVEDYEA